MTPFNKIISTLLFACISFSLLHGQAGGTWTELEALPVPQSEFHGAAIGDYIYVLGGERKRTPETDVDRAADELWIYDTGADTWTLGALMPESRNHPAVTAHGGYLYVFGGYPQACCDSYPWPGGTTSAWRYDPAEDEWTELAPVPREIGAGMAEAFEDKIYVMAGTEVGPFNSVGKVHAYDPVANSWQDMTPMVNAREHVRGCVMDSLIFVVGGHSQPDNQRINQGSVEAYAPASDTWYDYGQMPDPRGGLGVSCIAGKIYVFGGERVNFSTLSNLDRFDPVTDEWDVMEEVPANGIHGMAVVVHEGVAHMIGGSEEGGMNPKDWHHVYTPPQVSGCTDPDATNYDRYATTDDGSCEPAGVSTAGGTLEGNITLQGSRLNVSGLEHGRYQLSLSDIKGQLIFTRDIRGNTSLPLGPLPMGIITVKISSSGGIYSQKIFVSR